MALRYPSRVFGARVMGDVIVILGLAMIVVVMFWDSLFTWWTTEDDLLILFHAYYLSPLEYFFEPLKYRLLTTANLTPWVTLSFDMDCALFGLDPRGFHAHGLVSFALLVVSSYSFLRLWTGRLEAFLCSVLVMLLKPVAMSAFALPMRHYVEGLIFSIWSLYFFYYFRDRKNDYRLLIASALLYALACTAKEVYVPLVVFMFFSGTYPRAERIRGLSPHIIVALAYCVWRYYMLGQLVGGYEGHGGSSDLADYSSNVWIVMRAIPDALFTNQAAGYGLMIAFAIVLSVSLYRKKTLVTSALVGFVCVLTPLVPVAFLISAFGIDNLLRYFLVIGWTLIIVVGTITGEIANRKVRAIFLVFLAICAGLLGESDDRYFQGSRQTLARLSGWGRLVWYNGDHVILDPRTLTFLHEYLGGVSHLKDIVKGTSSPLLYTDPLPLIDLVSGRSAYVLSNIGGADEASKEFAQSVQRMWEDSAVNYSLVQSYAWQGRDLLWHLDKPADGKYAAILYDGTRSYKVEIDPEAGHWSSMARVLFLYNIRPPAFVTFEHISTENHITYSPPIALPEYFWDWRGHGFEKREKGAGDDKDDRCAQSQDNLGEGRYSIDSVGEAHGVALRKAVTIDASEDPIVSLRGWAVDEVARALAGDVVIMLDGKPVSQALYGFERPDVARALGETNYSHSGWKGFLNISRASPGLHRLSLHIISEDGKRCYAPDGNIIIEVE